ncbi:MAG: amino acid adenylation domain-containing protein [Treponema sp.]|jgi:amino acid adenylation domain-containing protein|nr:amino acid adenylation domain-containing protein [Treponema sp.]
MSLSDKTFLHAFQKQAARTPERIALSDATGVAVTYSQAQKYANHVSRKLTQAGVGRGDIVAIFLGRTAFFPIAAIGTFQAGAAYMPIEPRYPDSRIAFMLEDSEAKVLITSPELRSHTTGYTGRVLYAEDLWVEEEHTPEPLIDGNDRDYIIYTSGTTGKPKGAMNVHKGLMNLIDFYAEELRFNEQDISGVYCSFGFDVSVMQMFPFLAKGAGVDIVPTEVMLDMPGLSRYTREHGITTMHLPPSVIRFFDPFCEGTPLKSVVAVGDRLTYGPGRNFKIYNMYGPAEASVVITTFLVDKEYENYPIGTFVKNNCGYIVDEQMHLVPDGEAGELCLAGIHIGTGYLKRPELTAEKFVKNPFSADPEYGTIYRTGDLCRVLPDGNYEFLGRIDTQVKIRGFRVELGEIETTMRKYEGVKEAICGAFEDKGRGEKYIVGYYTAEQVLDEKGLQEYLSESLPFYMIPSMFVKLEAIPLNANGKYDRKALAEPARGEGHSRTETPEEQVLAECLWEIYPGRPLDFEQTFSEAGGDSLGAIQLITLLIEKQFTLNIANILNPENSLRDIARLLVPHVASIRKKPAGVWEKPAEWSDEQFNRVVAQYGRENIERIYDLTLLQNLLLTFCLTHPGEGVLHIQNSYAVQGSLDIETACRAFAVVVRKHPVLQAAVVHRDVPIPKQIILSHRGLEITVSMDKPLDIVVEREFRRGFDLENDNLLRIILLKERTKYTHIIVSVHHVIIDGWSLGVLMNDFAETYRKLAKGTPITLLEEEIEQQHKDAFSHEDFINYINGLDQNAAISYFVKKVAGYNTKADMIHDYPNPQGNWDYSIEFLDIPQNIVEGIRTVARQCQVSPAAVYEGVYAFLLQKECGSSDVVFNTLSNERGYPIKNIANMIGFFFNRMPARVTIDTDASFVQFFTLVQKQITEDLKYGYVDFLEVEKHCGYQTSFNYYQTSFHFTLTDDVYVSFNMEHHVSFDNIFFTVEAGESTRIQLQYNKCNYAPDTIKRFLHAYLSLLEYIISHAHAKLYEATQVKFIDSLNSEEKREI